MHAMGTFLGRVFFLVRTSGKTLVLSNLTRAYPHLSRPQRNRLAREFYVSLARSPLKAMYAFHHPRYVAAVRIRGRQHLDDALASGKGVIALTAHLGNFAVMHWALARCGYAVSVMQRPIKNKKINAYLTGLEERMGVIPLYSHPRTEAIRTTIAALRHNRTVFIMLDQDFGSRGIWVRFLGHHASIALGPVVLALRTQAAVVPIYTYTDTDGREIVTIMPRQELIIDQDRQKTLLSNAVRFNRIIESWIREHPEQWGWITRRWRSQPQERDYRSGRVEV
jgi:KDO2-lipid IV(A) lauroyltransferase